MSDFARMQMKDAEETARREARVLFWLFFFGFSEIHAAAQHHQHFLSKPSRLQYERPNSATN